MKGTTKLTGLYLICQSLLIGYKLWFNTLYPVSWKTVFTPTLVLGLVLIILVGIGVILSAGNRKDKKLW